jgi:transcriptional regulator NrdR family protein
LKTDALQVLEGYSDNQRDLFVKFKFRNCIYFSLQSAHFSMKQICLINMKVETDQSDKYMKVDSLMIKQFVMESLESALSVMYM